jgi:hypothetical protein
MAIPADGVLLHIGVHKTGTTALQAALADARAELAQAGVLYPQSASVDQAAHHREAMSSLGYTWGFVGRDSTTASPKAFDDMAREVRDWSGRVCLSSEFWCEATADQASRVVDALGRPRVRIVVMLRNLGDVLASSWQQYLKYGMVTSYEDWLADVFSDQSRRLTPSFWTRQDHVAMLRRWIGAVGAERITVVVLDHHNRTRSFSAISDLLGIDPHILASRSSLTSNRSLTAAEAEVLRLLNTQVADTLSWDDYRRQVREGVARSMVESRRPAMDEPAIRTPEWACDEAARRGALAAEEISSLGVDIVGDVADLARRTPSLPASTVETLPIDAAVAALVGAVQPTASVDPFRQVGRAMKARVRRAFR